MLRRVLRDPPVARSTQKPSRFNTVSLAQLLSSDPADAQDPRHAHANELANFPPEATLSPLMDPENDVHVSERIPGDGIVVLGMFYDLVDSRPMQALTRDIASDRVTCLVVVGRPRSVSSDTFRNKMSYAKQVGGARDILSPSRDLATLLDASVPRDPDYNRLRNGLVLIVDGAIVWRSVAKAETPDAPHDISGLVAAIAHYSK